MKKTLIYALISTVALVVIIVLLNNQPKQEERTAVTLNTVSGEIVSSYKSLQDLIENQDDVTDGMPITIKSENTTVASSPKDNKVYYFCGNKNSKVYHTLHCGSVKNTKEENKVYFSDENECINNGYKPCKNCKP